MVKKLCQRCGEIYNDYDAQSYKHYCDACQERIDDEEEIDFKTKE